MKKDIERMIIKMKKIFTDAKTGTTYTIQGEYWLN